MNEPRKYVSRFTLVLIPAISCLVAVQSAQSAEPVYNGKPLSEWLLLNAARDDSATEAIRQIGTNAIPTLLDLLSTTEWNKKRVVSKLKSKGFRKEFLGRHAETEDIRTVAVDGFKILGTNAESAIPQLTKLLHESEPRLEVAYTLAGIGTKGFAVLTNAINDEDLAGVLVLAIG